MKKFPIGLGRFHSKTCPIDFSKKFKINRTYFKPPRIPHPANIHQIKNPAKLKQQFFPRAKETINGNTVLTLFNPKSLPQCTSLTQARKPTSNIKTLKNRNRKDRFKRNLNYSFKKCALQIEKQLKKHTTFQFAGQELMKTLMIEARKSKMQCAHLIATSCFFLTKLATMAVNHGIPFEVENIQVPQSYFLYNNMPNGMSEGEILNSVVRKTAKLIDVAMEKENIQEPQFTIDGIDTSDNESFGYQPSSPTISAISTSIESQADSSVENGDTSKKAGTMVAEVETDLKCFSSELKEAEEKFLNW